MSAYDHVGADGSYPEVAARAVMGVQQQTPSPIYGYLRSGLQQKIYLFHTLEQGSGWLATIVHGQSQPYDYAAVFAVTDLSQPVPGLESFGATVVSGDALVGSVLPFLLGLPLGGLGGYFLRRWQEEHPGHALPFVPPGKLPAPVIPPHARAAGDYVGGPWLDVEPAPWLGGPWLGLEEAPYVGGPWLDLVSPYDDPWLASLASPSHARVTDWLGASNEAARVIVEAAARAAHDEGAHPSEYVRRHAWPQTHALIESAKREVAGYEASYPAAAWIWALDPTGSSSVPGVQLTGGTSSVTPFSSHDQALDYMRSRAQTPHVALALFDVASPHWPNPVSWTQSDDPAYASVVAQHLGQSAQAPRMGADGSAVGAALEGLRARAQELARGRAGSVVGVIHTAKDDRWHTLAFRTEDDADDWLDTATHSPSSYTYAAYFNKADARFWPGAVIEKVSGMRAPPGTELRRRAATSGWWAA